MHYSSGTNIRPWTPQRCPIFGPHQGAMPFCVVRIFENSCYSKNRTVVQGNECKNTFYFLMMSLISSVCVPISLDLSRCPMLTEGRGMPDHNHARPFVLGFLWVRLYGTTSGSCEHQLLICWTIQTFRWKQHGCHLADIFKWKKMFVFWLKFQCSLFMRVA